MSEAFTIYAFQDKETHEFLYVGVTRNPKSRRQCHYFKRPFLRHHEWRVLRTVSGRDPRKIEGQVIAACKRRGQCKLNSDAQNKSFLKREKETRAWASAELEKILSGRGDDIITLYAVLRQLRTIGSNEKVRGLPAPKPIETAITLVRQMIEEFEADKWEGKA